MAREARRDFYLSSKVNVLKRARGTISAFQRSWYRRVAGADISNEPYLRSFSAGMCVYGNSWQHDLFAIYECVYILQDARPCLRRAWWVAFLV